MKLPEICQLKSRDLVYQYYDMIKYNSYQQTLIQQGSQKPSKFNEIALREEILRRCNKYEDWLESDREDLAKGITHRAI